MGVPEEYSRMLSSKDTKERSTALAAHTLIGAAWELVLLDKKSGGSLKADELHRIICLHLNGPAWFPPNE